MTFHVTWLLVFLLIAVSNASDADDALSYCNKHVNDIDDDLLKLAAIPSISSLPEHAKDIVAASEWLMDKLKASGLEVRYSQYNTPAS